MSACLDESKLSATLVADARFARAAVHGCVTMSGTEARRMRRTTWVGALCSLLLGSACASSSDNPTVFGGRDSGHDGRAPTPDGALGGGPGLNSDAGGADAPTVAPPSPHGCDATCAAAGGQCVNKVCTLHENPGQVTATTQQALQTGGSADASFTWLYPYDATVFPRGLIPPLLQFGGAAPDGVLLHITYSSMDYVGYFAGSSPGQLRIPAASWAAITEGAWASDVVQVDVTKISGGKVTGPITERWSIAQGSMRGQIYYETYGSPLAGGPDSVGIMSIAPGAASPTVMKSGCGNVCHTASADGSTLVANVALGFSSASYDLKTNASTIFSAPSEIFTYGGIYPDGSFVMSATNYRTWINAPSRLYDTTTGANIPAAGWDNVITNAGTTAFSPDGTRLAFVREDLDDGAGHTLAMMNFSHATSTFSALINLATHSNGTVGWPAFTPDTRTVVYHVGSDESFETDNGATGDVYQVDLATRAVARLDALDGYAPSGITYLPAKDPDLSFAPTVLPEAVGGYFWAVFTSHRSYGNSLPSQDNGDQNGKLWVAAIDLTITPGKDSSHPAFYLDGQESAADNLRGFWVLPPCKQSGAGCSSGDECCTGFCRGAAGASSCVMEPGGSCSNEYERCTATSDCCEASAGYECIGGYCAAPAAPPVPK